MSKALHKILDFVLTLIHDRFTEFYLLAIFLMGGIMIARWPMNEKLIGWITAGAVIGAILGLVTNSNKKEEKP